MRPCQVVRVFTRGDEGGNHLGVINDRTGLNTESMQQIASDLGFSETAFIGWRDGEPPHVRIFTPASELPFAGHPLVGTAWVMLELGPGGIDKLRCGIGDVGVRREGETVWIDAPMPQDAVTEATDDLLARAALPEPGGQWDVAMPLLYRLVEYGGIEEIASAEPDMKVLAETFGTYIYARKGGQVRARFFAPETAVPEDPATGSAAVALATALTAQGEAEGRVTIFQGEEMGHPSRIELVWRGSTASIGGTVRRDEVRLLES